MKRSFDSDKSTRRCILVRSLPPAAGVKATTDDAGYAFPILEEGRLSSLIHRQAIPAQCRSSVDPGDKRQVRRFWRFLAMLAVAVSQSGPACAESPAEKQNPPRGRNVIVFLLDDLGFGELQAYRRLYRYDSSTTDEPSTVAPTPNIDKLADEGIVCTRAYAQPWCAPARQALLSGMWSNRISAYGRPWIGCHMRALGLRTLMVGKNHGDLPARRILEWQGDKTEFDETFHIDLGEFTYYRNPANRFKREAGDVILRRNDDRAVSPYVPAGEEYITDLFARQIVDFVDRQVASGKSFFIYGALNAPHSPLQGKPEDLRALFPEKFGTWSDEKIRQDGMNWRASKFHREHIMAMVHAVDRAVGTVRERLKEHGIDDDTLIILTSDNGGARDGEVIRSFNHPLSGAKHDTLEGGIRVPFIVRSGALAASRTKPDHYDGLVSICDILPTALRYVDPGFDLRKTATDGDDIMPCLLGLKPEAVGRRYFLQARIATARSRSFEEPQDGFNAVLIEDHLKIMRISRDFRKREEFHEVMQSLPDLVNGERPVEGLRENYDADNDSQPATKSALIRSLDALLSAEGADFTEEWSGNPASYRLTLPVIRRYLGQKPGATKALPSTKE